MSGHSKWHNIRLRKGAQDAGRAKIFAKVTREIIVAVKQGGGDPNANPRLRTAIDKARDVSMPNDNIQRAIRRGTGEEAGANYEEIVYEGYGPGGVALYIQTATDNRNRTVADLRHVLGRHGGSLGESGSVAWLFERKGLVVVDRNGLDEDKLMELALEAGAEDLSPQNGTYEVVTAFEALDRMRIALEQHGIKPLSAQPQMIPKTTVSLEGEQARKMVKLMNGLEDLEDVQNVSANFDIPEELLEADE